MIISCVEWNLLSCCGLRAGTGLGRLRAGMLWMGPGMPAAMGSSSASGDRWAFVNSKGPHVPSSHNMKICGSWEKKERLSLALFVACHTEFPAVLVSFLAKGAFIPFPLPRFSLYWQGGDWKVCRVFWVSVQNNSLCLVVRHFFYASDCFGTGCCDAWSQVLGNSACLPARACLVCSFVF